MRKISIILLLLAWCLNGAAKTVEWVASTSYTAVSNSTKQWNEGCIDAYTNWTATAGNTMEPYYMSSSSCLNIATGGTFTLNSSKRIVSAKFTFYDSATTLEKTSTNNIITYYDIYPSQSWYLADHKCYIKKIEITYADEGLTVSSAGYATFAPLVNVSITSPDGGDIYYVRECTSTSIKLARHTGGTLKAGEGVILKGAGKTFEFTQTDEACPEITGNLLQGTTEAISLEETSEIYILANGSSGIGFYPNAAGTLAAGKAYLPASAVGGTQGQSAPKSLMMEFEETEDATAIASPASSNADTTRHTPNITYNLTGQQVAPSYKGVVIKNGKKYRRK